MTDKPAEISARAPLTTEEIERAAIQYRCRAESLLAIDEGVKRIVTALRRSGELANTVIIYTSDHGFFHGEHRIAGGKNRVYEEAIRVPLMIRGPGIDAGITVREITINADLVPTVLDAAGAESGLVTDGISLLPATRHPGRMRGRELLIEQLRAGETGEDQSDVVGTYAAIRNHRYAYVEHSTGERELYDLGADPFQLQSLAGDPAYATAEAVLAARLAELRDCIGRACRTRPDLDLRLPRKVRDRGRSCRRAKGFLVKVRGQDTRHLTGVRLFSGKDPAGRLGEAPWKRTIRPRLLRGGKGSFQVRARAELVDGRVASLQERTRICR